jgi:predicted nucleic acid-binding protein
LASQKDVVLDADFLSAFLKIDQLPLVKELYQAKELLIPPSVYREIGATRLLADLAALPWLRVQPPNVARVQELFEDEEFAKLGPGEQEAIALSFGTKTSVLLMNDNRARQLAARFGVEVLNIPAFLLACKEAGLLGRAAIEDLIVALEERDRYGFRKTIRNLLLS